MKRIVNIVKGFKEAEEYDTDQNRKEYQSTSEDKDKLEEGSGNENLGMFLLDATVADQ